MMTKTAGADRPARQKRGLSISSKLVIAIAACVAAVMVLFVLVVNNQMSQVLLTQAENLLKATTNSTVQQAGAWVNGTLTRLEAQRDTIQYEDMTEEEIASYVVHTAGMDEAYPAGLYIAIVDGPLYHATFQPGPEYDASTKSWYQNGIASEAFILGDVYFDEDSQSYVVGTSGVLHATDGSIRGVAAADVYLDAVSEIVQDVTIETTGGIFLVDTRTDTVIGHQNADVVGRALSDLTDDPVFIQATELIGSGKTGVFNVDGEYLNIEKIPGSDWVAVAYVSQAEVLQDLQKLTFLMAGMALAAVIAIIILVIVMVRNIVGRPVRELSQAASAIADGDLEQKITYHSRDELGTLAEDFGAVTRRLSDYVEYIDEIADTLEEIAEGNLDFTLKHDYVGEFAKIKTSLEDISRELNGTMSHLRDASRDVAMGAAQISSEATSLSQGSTEQAAEVDSMARNISSVSANVGRIAAGAEEASTISDKVQTGLEDSQKKMRAMTQVIQGISAKSTQIHQIVQTIEDIAFQTNILALNAAVEAARAGNSGKGFAVVADEVRTLASKSSEAAQETSALLSQTVDSMADSVKAAEDTEKALDAVMDQAEHMRRLLTDIAGYTKVQAKDAADISHGIQEISTVSQHNVAAVEASAAASEQLSGQADLLKDMVAKFRLKGPNGR